RSDHVATGAQRRRRAGGGLAALGYALGKAREAGAVALTRRLATHNACKTCAVGMGGQAGGMRNEAGSFPEVCKKSVQAVAADMQSPITAEFFAQHDTGALERMTSRELQAAGRLGFPIAPPAGEAQLSRVAL